MSHEGIPQQIAALRRRFVERTAREREQIALLLQDLCAGIPSDERLTELRCIAHGLAGAGGTFGFPAISDAAGRVEELCMAGRADDLAEALEELMAELARIV